MSTRAAIYQPQYFPRLHYVNRVLDSDVFVLLNSAQYTKSLVHDLGDGRRERRKSFQSHAPIKHHDGLHLLTLPVTSGSKHAPIDEVWPVHDQKWRAQHRNTLDAAYGRAPYFDERFAEVDELLTASDGSLADLNTTTLLWAVNVVLDLGLRVGELTLERVNQQLATSGGARLRQIVLDPQTGVERPDGRQMGGRWTAALCEAVGADEYLYGGTAGAGYMSPEDYTSRGVALIQQDWQGRRYPQQFDERFGFLPNLSILDLLFNVDPEEAFDILHPGSPGVPSAPGEEAPGARRPGRPVTTVASS